MNHQTGLPLSHSVSSQQVANSRPGGAAGVSGVVNSNGDRGLPSGATATTVAEHARQSSEPFPSFQKAASKQASNVRQPLGSWTQQRQQQQQQQQQQQSRLQLQQQQQNQQQPSSSGRRLLGGQHHRKPQFIRPDRLAHLYHAFVPNHRPRSGGLQLPSAAQGRDPLASMGRQHHHQQQQQLYETAGSILSSDLDTTSFFDSEDEAESSRFSTTTATTMSSNYFHKFRQRQRRAPRISRASSFSSITESSLSLNVITVTLDMESMQFLGISIVGQASRRGADGGIYVGSIMKGGAVHQDGRIQPGDLILEVNGIPFDRMENDDAVRVLREQVQRAGPISLTVAKSWNCRQYLRVSQEEPVRPIDPRAWILHTNAVREAEALVDPDVILLPGTTATPPQSMATAVNVDALDANRLGNEADDDVRSLIGDPLPFALPPGGSAAAARSRSLSSSSSSSSARLAAAASAAAAAASTAAAAAVAAAAARPAGGQHVERPKNLALQQQQQAMHHSTRVAALNVHSDCCEIVRALRLPDSGLEVRDRVWLKIRIPCAFIGGELVDWLLLHVDGFRDRRQAKKLACQLLRSGLIRHTVNKASFSEQCYYIFASELPPPPPNTTSRQQPSHQVQNQQQQHSIHHYHQLEDPAKLAPPMIVKLPPIQQSSSAPGGGRSFSSEQLLEAAFSTPPLPPPPQNHSQQHLIQQQQQQEVQGSLPRKPLPMHHLSNTATAGGTVLSVGSGSSSSQKSSIIASYSSAAAHGGNYNNMRLAHCS